MLGVGPGDLVLAVGALSGARRDQFRRDRRAEPQLCRPQPRQSRRDRATPAQSRSPRAAALQGIDKMRANLALGPGPGHLPAAAAPEPRLARRARHDDRGAPTDARAPTPCRASAMWAANAATVSPAPDTADGRCHLTVANLRTMPHRSHEWPATLAQLRLAFADDAHFAVHAPVPPTFGDEGAANHMRLAPRARRAGRRDLRLRRRAAAPSPRASMSRRRRRSPGCTGSIRRAPCSSAQSRRGDRRRRLPQRRRRGRQRACAVRARAGVRRPATGFYAELRRLLPEASRSSKCRRRRGAASPTRSDPICSTPSW